MIRTIVQPGGVVPTWLKVILVIGAVSAAAEWAVNECRSRDAAEIPRCSRVLQEVVNYCNKPWSRRR